MHISKFIIFSIVSLVMLTSCAREMSSNVYTSNSASGKVIEGKIISARKVTIKDSEKLQDNTIGMLAGGITGGVAGANMGKGNGNSLAAVGAAIVGATAGAFIQDKLGTSEGMEYIVRIDKKYLSNLPSKKSRRQVTFGVNSASDDVNQSIDVAETKTDLISIIQKDKEPLQKGQHVLVIYNNDRPRISAIN